METQTHLAVDHTVLINIYFLGFKRGCYLFSLKSESTVFRTIKYFALLASDGATEVFAGALETLGVTKSQIAAKKKPIFLSQAAPQRSINQLCFCVQFSSLSDCRSCRVVVRDLSPRGSCWSDNSAAEEQLPVNMEEA